MENNIGQSMTFHKGFSEQYQTKIVYARVRG